MCGRYSLVLVGHHLIERFGVQEAPLLLHPRYNIAPSQELPIVTMEQPQQLTTARWGLRPVWMADRPGDGLINARAETVATKSSFREAITHHRCLIPADGFYEWDHQSGVKQPYRFTLDDGTLFSFAGLYTPPAVDNPTQYAIITTVANPLVATVHDRMPVILNPADEAAWLDPQVPLPKALKYLQPFPEDRMRRQAVSTRLNNARFDDPSLLSR